MWYWVSMAWQTDDTVDFEIATWSPSAWARIASTVAYQQATDESGDHR